MGGHPPWTTVVRLDRGGVAVLHGRGEVRVREGAAEVAGFRVVADAAAVRFYAPFSEPPAEFAAAGGAPAELEVRALQLPADVGLGLRGSPEVAALEALFHPPARRLADDAAGGEPPEPRRAAGEWTVLVPGVYRCAVPPAYRLAFTAEMAGALDALVAAAELAPRVVLVVGDKGTGKSTFNRVLLNRLLAGGGRAPLLLDADVGQPEAALPGVVALGPPPGPLLGPPFMHVAADPPAAAVFVGAVSVGPVSRLFMRAVDALANRTARARAVRSVIVNTHGWVRDVGLHTLRAMVDGLRPDALVLLARPDELEPDARPDDDVTHRIDAGLPRLDELADVLARAASALGATFLRLRSSVPLARPPVSLRPHDLRDLRICAHLARYAAALRTADEWAACPPEELARISRALVPMVAREPYALSWADVAVCCQHTVVPPEQMARVLNASLVALLHDPEEAAAAAAAARSLSPHARRMRVLRRPSLGRCVGVGVVRAVDVPGRRFLVVTSVDPGVLAGVNVLAVGGVQLPAALFRWSQSHGIPYAP
jgi:hypothetical protein